MNTLAARARALAPAATVAVALALGVSQTLEAASGDWLLLTAAGIVSAALVDVFTTQSTTAAVAREEQGTFTTLGAPATVVVQAPKLGNHPDENEDACAVDEERGCYVVSDGASSSFASRAWAQALCGAFVEAPSAAWSLDDFAACVVKADGVWRAGQASATDVPWWAEEGLRRGAHATVAVLTLGARGDQRIWRASAIGDSCVFQLRASATGWTIVCSMPLSDTRMFGGHPSLVHTGASPATADIVVVEGTALAGDVFVLATDAVAEWILRDPANVTPAAVGSPAELQRTLDSLRERVELDNDDLTLLRVTIE